MGFRAGTGESGTVCVCPLERLVTRKTPRASRLHGCRRPGGPSTPGWRPPGCLRWARSCRPRRWPAWPRRVGGVRSRPHPRSPEAPVPFKANAARRHHIPKQRHRVTNWAEYDASLRQRGSLTVWFTEEAIAAWRAEPRTTRGGQPWYSPLAITDGADAAGRVPPGAAPDRRADRLHPPPARPRARRAGPHHAQPPGRDPGGAARPRSGSGPLHLLVDSTGLKLGGPGEWLVEKHGTKTRRSWRKLHLGVDAGTGRIDAVELTDQRRR